MDITEASKQSLRERLNQRVYGFGAFKISLVNLCFLIAVNTSLVCIVINFFARGVGILEWWSIYVTAFLIFSYLMLRVFTSSGIMLGRQVTFLITLFNIFLNLMKVFGMVKSNQHWELTFLIPLVNLVCLSLLVFVFWIRRKKFRAIIFPSLKIAIISIVPIVRLYFLQGDNYMLPVFNYIVLVLAFALFINSLFFNWLNIVRITEKNITMIKKGATEFQRASQKVATVNKKIDSLNVGVSKVKSFFQTSGMAFKEFFTFKRKKEKTRLLPEGEQRKKLPPARKKKRLSSLKSVFQKAKTKIKSSRFFHRRAKNRKGDEEDIMIEEDNTTK